VTRERKIEILQDLIHRGRLVVLTLDGAGGTRGSRVVKMGMPLHLGSEYGGRWAVKLVLQDLQRTRVDIVGLTKILKIEERTP
jgi:hypothetical protein